MTEPRTPNPLLATLARLLEEALARIVALDPDGAAVLAPLEGRAVELTWSGPDLGLRARVENATIRIGPPAADKPDLSMRGPLAGFAKLAFPGSIGKLATGKVEMSGDAELARELGRMATAFSPDFEAPFTRALGPALGTLVARGLRQAFELARGAGAGFARDAALYVTEESRDTVAREELEDFLDAVDRVRDDADRLAARVAALGKHA